MILHLLIISALGGLIYLDSGPLGQWMISQPIVCAPLIGWILGSPVTGLMIGALLQLLWTGRLPVGSSIPPESPFSAVVATIVFIFAKKTPEVGIELDWMTMVMAISCGIGAGVLGGRMTVASRELNDRFCVYADQYIQQGSWRKINLLPWIGNILLWLCASLTIFVFCGISLMALSYIQNFHISIGFFRYYSWILVTLGIAIILDLFHVKTRLRLLISGLILGFGIGYFTHFVNR
jgi:mannose PTS system EIIC component